MIFDTTISIGNIITILAFLFGGAMLIGRTKANVNILSERLQSVEKEIHKLTEVLVTLGRQDERLTAIDKRVEDLRRGRGYVKEDFPSHRE